MRQSGFLFWGTSTFVLLLWSYDDFCLDDLCQEIFPGADVFVDQAQRSVGKPLAQ